MAISKQSALDILKWFKDELDSSIDSKLATVTGGNGDENVIETVKVNNSKLPVSGKAVNIDLSPYAKTSDLSPYATTNEVNQKLATVTGGDKNVIESISIDGTRQPVINKNVDLNLSGFATKTEINNVLHSISSLSWAINSISNYTIVVEGGESLKPATTTELGGVIVGEGLSITNKGVLSAQPVIPEVEMPIASKTELGGIIAGAGLSIKDDGTLSVIPPESVGEFFLTPATRYDLGGVIVGKGLSVTDEGVLSVTATGQSNVIENISIDGKLQTVTNKTAILSLSAFAKKNEVGSGIRMKGSVESKNHLPINALAGDLYNIKNGGGSDDSGIAIKSGDNVVYTADGKWDVMAGFVDTSHFITTDDFSDELQSKLAGLSNFVLSAATTEKLGGVIVGSGLSITKEGVLSADATSVFLGARETQGGGIGLVPAPLAGQNNLYLRGDGYWARFPTESLNVVVGGGSLNGVNVEAITYPPNQQGMLWMDVGDEESLVAPCLRLRHNDYEYIFKADTFTETTVNTSHSTTGGASHMIYYLGTVPSEINGGLWYTLENNEYPTLHVLRKWTDNRGNEFEFTAGYNYDLIHYKAPPVDGLYSYWLWRPGFSGDIYHRNWTTTVPAPVVEKTDHGVYALRNLNTALTNTTTESAGWLFSRSLPNTSTTVDFWISWNEDVSPESVAIFANGGQRVPIIRFTSSNNYYYIYIEDNAIYYRDGITSEGAPIKLFGSLEQKSAQRIHFALAISKTGNTVHGGRLFVNGIATLAQVGLGRVTHMAIFPYMVGTETEYRPLYIDHLRIWEKLALTNDKFDDFEPPKPEDYIIW